MRASHKSILHPKVSPLTGCERSNYLGLRCFEAQNPCHTGFHAVEFPIRYSHKFHPQNGDDFNH